jgi:hypothetical protein
MPGAGQYSGILWRLRITAAEGAGDDQVLADAPAVARTGTYGGVPGTAPIISGRPGTSAGSITTECGYSGIRSSGLGSGKKP